MLKKWSAALALIILTVGCGITGQTINAGLTDNNSTVPSMSANSDSPVPPPASAIPTNPTSSIIVLPSNETAFPSTPEQTPTDLPYKAYYQKYLELTAQYGTAEIAENTEHGSGSYLNGVCIVDLLDFNGDGVQDLLVIYANGQINGTNMVKFGIPQAGSYGIEIWTYTNGAMTLLLRESQVGSYCSFRTNYWDADNCFATVYESGASLPVIQLYGETDDHITYTNYYDSDGTVVKDEFTYGNHVCQKNGSAISEAEWDTGVAGYDKIILCARLSSDDNIPASAANDDGVNFNNTLSQTRRVTDTLSQSQPSSFDAAGADYIPLYGEEIARVNRERIDAGDMQIPHKYGIYDIDQNGVPELLILTGDCEANFLYHVYTVINGGLIYCIPL